MVNNCRTYLKYLKTIHIFLQLRFEFVGLTSLYLLLSWHKWPISSKCPMMPTIQMLLKLQCREHQHLLRKVTDICIIKNTFFIWSFCRGPSPCSGGGSSGSKQTCSSSFASWRARYHFSWKYGWFGHIRHYLQCNFII